MGLRATWGSEAALEQERRFEAGAGGGRLTSVEGGDVIQAAFEAAHSGFDGAVEAGCPRRRAQGRDPGFVEEPHDVLADEARAVVTRANSELARMAPGSLRAEAGGSLAQGLILLRDDGKVIWNLRKPWRDGTRGFVLDPLVFIERLVALIPHPREHQITYHGVLAPASCGPIRRSRARPDSGPDAARDWAEAAQRKGSSESSSPFTGAGSSLGLRSRLAQEAADVQDALDAAARIALHTLHLSIVERGRAVELGARSRAVGQVDNIQHHGVEVNATGTA